ncbi:ABC transporter permease [Streptantibioticus ferralitis]|uniref:ABC transporter permease n=1 Tax=Streptantibioticus ferralitis TaxID=236510 RepID=A0ABT5Z1L7_9ACTN|nr:ABC transporter permease [Streptantibioticus ferralitis]MDF2257736.1 ABC transporter permease [Streptantibioticus ferralitis]
MNQAPTHRFWLPNRGVLVQSIALGIAEFRTFYTLRAWLAGWFVRVLAQVAFFASIGLLLHSKDQVRYLLVGNAVALVCLEATVVVLTMAAERFQGTLELLATSPVGPVTVLLGRGLNWVLTGVVSSALTLTLLLLVFGQTLSVPGLLGCLPVLLLIGLTSHFYGSALGAITLRFPRVEWMVLNVGFMMPMTLSGVNVPVSFWPTPLAALAQVFPVTHGLAAIRTILSGGSMSHALGQAALEPMVGMGWLVIGALLYRRMVESSRRRGSLGLF